eukprot:15365837-Ditylum_brightwellii.AAC.1
MIHTDNTEGPAKLSKDLPSAKIINDRPRDARNLKIVKHCSFHFQPQNAEAVEQDFNENIDNKSIDLNSATMDGVPPGSFPIIELYNNNSTHKTCHED